MNPHLTMNLRNAECGVGFGEAPKPAREGARAPPRRGGIVRRALGWARGQRFGQGMTRSKIRSAPPARRMVPGE